MAGAYTNTLSHTHTEEVLNEGKTCVRFFKVSKRYVFEKKPENEGFS